MNWRTSAIVMAAILQPTICCAQSAIGNAASVTNDVQGILGGQTSRITSGSSVRSNELIRSGDGAVANLVFLDQTRLSVGPRSEVRLDKFVYNPDQRTGAMVINLNKGAYRFVTGVQDSKNYEIKTLVATMGIRGTILEISLESYRGEIVGARACESNVKVRLVEGAFTARTISGRNISVTDPESLSTICSDGSFQVTPNSASILNFPTEFAVATPNFIQPNFIHLGIGVLAVGGTIGIISNNDNNVVVQQNSKPVSP